eukprot:NODE_392_length_9456_cov_0.345517.p1 type:complete len:1184 gc:universal NODE_392_length_9456_cov_0.345517:3704-153(-)
MTTSEMKKTFHCCKQLCMPYKYHYEISERNNKEELIEEIKKYLLVNENSLCEEIKSWGLKYIDELPQSVVTWLENDLEYAESVINDHVCSNNRIVLLIVNFHNFNDHFKFNGFYYDIIRYGLCDDDMKVRKMSYYLLEKTIDALNGQVVEVEKFFYRPEILDDWEMFMVCCNVIQEQQFHLFQQIIPNILYLWSKYNSNLKMIKWIISLLNRGLKNGSNGVRKSVAIFILTSEVGSQLYDLDHRFLFQQLFKYLDDNGIFTSQGVGHLYSEFGDKFCVFIRKLIVNSESQYYRFKELLQFAEHFGSHLALYFYLSGIIDAIECCPILQNEQAFMKLLYLLKTHYFNSRLILVKSVVSQTIQVLDSSNILISKELCMSLINIMSQYNILQSYSIWSKCSESILLLGLACIKDVQFHYSSQTFKNFSILLNIVYANFYDTISPILIQSLVDEVEILEKKPNTHPSILLGLLKMNKQMQDKFRTNILNDYSISWLLNKIQEDDLTHLDRLMEYGNLLLDYQKLVYVKDEKLDHSHNNSLLNTLVFLVKGSLSCKQVLNYELDAHKELSGWIYKFKLKCATSLITPNDVFTCQEILDLVDVQSSSMYACCEFVRTLIHNRCVDANLNVLIAIIHKSIEVLQLNNKHSLVRQLLHLIIAYNLTDTDKTTIKSILLHYCNKTPYISEIMVKELINAPNSLDYIVDFTIFGPNREFYTLYNEALITKSSQIPGILQSDQNTRILAIKHCTASSRIISQYLSILSNDDLYPLRDGSTGIAFKTKVRCYMAILVQSRSDTSVLVPHFKKFVELLTREQNLQIKVFIEWILCFICNKVDYMDQLITLIGYNDHVQSVISIAGIMIRFIVAGDCITSPIIDKFIIHYCSNSHYATRVHVQYIVYRLYESSASSDTSPIQTALIAIKNSFNSLTHKNFEKCIYKNYMMGHLHYVNDLNMEMLFNLIPLYMKFDFTEVIGLSTFKEACVNRDIRKYMKLTPDQLEAVEAWEVDGLYIQRKFSHVQEFDFSRQTTEMDMAIKKRNNVVVIGSLIDNPGNLAALCRTCEVFLMEQLVVNDVQTLKDSKFKNVSVSSENWIPVKEVGRSNIKEYLMELKNDGYTILALEQSNNSRILGKYEIPSKIVVLMGNETKGIPNGLLSMVDVCVEISQYGVTKSLNVNTATSMLLYEYMRQHVE